MIKLGIQRKLLILTFSIFFASSISVGSGRLALKTFSTCFDYIPLSNIGCWVAIKVLEIYVGCARTSLIRVSVWSISISPVGFFLLPFRDKVKSFLDWAFVIPLPLPAPVTAPPWDMDFFIPLPAPGWPPLWGILGSSPSQRISSGDIYHIK